ncbi:unnamed protein product [[Actinomadura] parvosata subsp. kistnae]|uniref:Uncharacterized protein n=2 Tax=Nonomuraea TaxID=83681 RepID=A0A1V0A865_9ACTN|nr:MULTISPECIES: hypothetical protein [unclassified Nonomuraea]AQZ66408.1 hypothetical protein BKM31_37615 [Nonomuraea sp. ATCC 55076]NJP89382.1 hypothetical protein [Nonomuraea sp. FMUSA5-5]SPL95546.1 unnamed protein product [Actinomadura parvosata subsp. kistnae]
MSLLDYTRSTRLCSMAELDDRLRAAMTSYADQQLLGDLDRMAEVCCETRSVPVKTPRGFLGVFRAAGLEVGPFTTAALVTTGVIVIATVTDKGTEVRLGARLADVSLTVADPATYGNATGVHVQARWFGSTEASSYLLPLDTGPAGRTFLERLRELTAATRHL